MLAACTLSLRCDVNEPATKFFKRNLKVNEQFYESALPWFLISFNVTHGYFSVITRLPRIGVETRYFRYIERERVHNDSEDTFQPSVLSTVYRATNSSMTRSVLHTSVFRFFNFLKNQNKKRDGSVFQRFRGRLWRRCVR